MEFTAIFTTNKFYPTVIYIVTKVLNKIENFKMFRDNEGNLCVWG